MATTPPIPPPCQDPFCEKGRERQLFPVQLRNRGFPADKKKKLRELLKCQRNVEEAITQGDWQFNDKKFPRKDWQYEVANGDTQIGYFDWVLHQYEVLIETAKEQA